MKNSHTKILILLMILTGACLPAASFAAQGTTNHFPADYRDVETEPTIGEPIQKYAVDGEEGPPQNFGVQPVHDNQVFATLKADRFEHQWREGGVEILLWDVEGWIGSDYNKLYLESEGEVRLDIGEDKIEGADLELLYSRNISKFWDIQAGIRHDFKPSPARSFLALGVQGLAPQWFEIDATAYLSEDGDVSAKAEVEYELMLTQRWVLIPRLEMGLSFQDVPEYEQWEGFTDVEVGARLMYHFRRELAPYVGVSWHRHLGETANRIESEGGDIDSAAFVAGLRFWF